jgi:hypothetical protein
MTATVEADSKIKELRKLLHALDELLADPHPGLMT